MVNRDPRTIALICVLIWALLFPNLNAGMGVEVDTFSITVRTDLVELFLSVREGNRYLQGLTKDDFTVLDDGEAQKLAFLDSEEFPLSVVLLLDTSGSMEGSIPYLQAAAVTFLESMRDQDEVALFTFGGTVKQVSAFTREKEGIVSMVDNIYADGRTPLYDSIAQGFSCMNQISGRRAIVIFTDGADTASRLSAESVIRRSGRSAVPLFSVGSGEALNNHRLKSMLQKLSRASGGQAHFVERAQDLKTVFDKISENLRSAYRAGYYSGRKPDGKWHNVSVALRDRSGEVVTRTGYYSND